MDENKIIVAGAAVVYTDRKPAPYNPLNRPEIHYGKAIIGLLFYSMGIIVLYFSLKRFGFPVVSGAVSLFTLILCFFFLKRFVIWCIHLYQNKARDEVRLRCLFEPSCSEYMILAIEKYGLFHGIWKGIGRLNRCHFPNGGVDYP